MKLASVRIENPQNETEKRDGRLVVVDDSGTFGVFVDDPRFSNLRQALEIWSRAEPVLKEISLNLQKGNIEKQLELTEENTLAALPRAWSFVDGSAFIHHIILVRKARGAEPPEDLKTVPLMYQGINDYFLSPYQDISLSDPTFGLDFEAEVAVILDDVPEGVTATEAIKHIKLFVLLNDLSLRNLIPRELKAGFGFFHGKPRSSLSPLAITPDELGETWKGGRVHLPLETWLNGKKFGDPDAGEMFFSFPQLIEHAAKTRALPAGTILGSGTVSNEDTNRGSSCLAEKRMLEVIEAGKANTPFLNHGDQLEIRMLKDKKSLFGSIKQKVVK